MDNPLVRITRDRITQLLELLGEDANDEELKLGMIEGETPLFELVTMLLAGIETDEGMIAALKEQIAMRSARFARAEQRIEQRKVLIQSLMDTAGVKKLPLPEATVWIAQRAASFKVTDVDALPKGYFTTVTIKTRKPDRDKIAAAIEAKKDLDGVTRTNGAAVLNLRRK